MIQKIFRSRVTTLLLLALCGVLAIHLLGNVTDGVRADVTADQLYSLTPGTEAILAKMHQEGVKPVEIQLYFSATAGKTLPKFIKDFISYDRYVRSLLREYQRASGGKIKLTFIDPLPDSDEAQQATEYGLEGKTINQNGDEFFFGLVFETQTGSRKAIPFLWPDQQENIEYEISKTLYNLLWPSTQRIGVISSLDVLGTDDQNPYLAQMLAAQGRQPQPAWIAMRLLREIYQVENIDRDVEHISHDEYNLVLVIHPKNLSQKNLWALDEWVATGGNALVFVDPYAADDSPPPNPQNQFAALQYQPASNLEPLLSAWGVKRLDDQFAADFDLAVKRPLRRGGPSETLLIDLRITEATRAQCLNQDSPVLQGLNDLRFLLPGALKKVEGTSAEVTPLITTTAAGNTLEIKAGFGSEGLHYFDFNDAAKLRDRFSPGSEPVVLAYQLHGHLGPAYPDGVDVPESEPAPPPGLPPGFQMPPPEGGATIHKDPVPEDQRKDATVLVFADVDVISDQLAFDQSLFGIVQASNDNHKLLLNSVDYLLGAKELMQVRAKHNIRRPFTLFDHIEASAEQETLERERQLRADIEMFQQQLNEKRNEITQSNAALFEKQLRDEVDHLNETIQERNHELREIRKGRRVALEHEEAKVRFSVLGWMPSLVLLLGIVLAVRRRLKAREARRS